MESQAPRVTMEGFDGPLDLLLELVEEKKLDIITVRLGDLADTYLARVRAMAELPAEEVSAFLALASRLQTRGFSGTAKFNTRSVRRTSLLFFLTERNGGNA